MYSAASPITPEGSPISRRSDRIHKLLDTILMSFGYDLENLPPEGRQAYSRFQQDKNYVEFATTLKRLVLEGHLDKFMRRSPAFLYPAIDLFDSRYPQLGLRGLLDEVEGRSKRGSPRPRSPGHSHKSQRRVKKEAWRKAEPKQAGEPSSVPANVNIARTLTVSAKVGQRVKRQGQPINWTRVEPRTSSQPQAVAGPPTAVPAIRFDPAEPSVQEEPPATSGNPLASGFVISTRSGDGAPDTDESRRAQNAAWLKDYVESRGILKPDFQLYPYKGWKIEQPRIMLNRARNFLADEDTDRTLGWGQKFAELTEYLSYLLLHWKGEDWGAELHEVIDMLHTHWLFEQYHYGTAKLNLKFENLWPKENKTRPPTPNAEYPIDGSGDCDMSERKLLLNPIKPATDVHYKLPQDMLKKYANVYASEAPFFWGLAPSSQSSRELAKLENNAFEKSLFSGVSTTVESIKKAKSRFESECDKEHLSTNSLNAFATLRGTRRAGLQQTLHFMSNNVNMEVCNIFRTLILPPPKIPEKPDAGIILPVMQVSDVPKKESRDPFGLTLGHKWYLDLQRFRANEERPHAIKECYGHRRWEERKEPIMDLPLNYKGPIHHDYLDHDMKKAMDLLKRCQILRDRISIQSERSRRPFLSNVVRFLLDGVSGKRWDETKIAFQGEDFVSGTKDLAHIRPKEEDFLRLLGEYPVNSTMVHPVTNSGNIGYQSTLFEERAVRILYGKGTTDTPEYEFEDFLEEINRDCDGPVKRWRFSEVQAMDELRSLDHRGIVELHDRMSVGRARADAYPEQRVKWLSTDQDLDAFLTGLESQGDKAPAGEVEASKEDKSREDDKSDVETMSTKVSIPETDDFGDYMFALPNIENLRSWEEVLGSDKEAVEEGMPKTQDLYQRLCFRLGRTIHDLRLKREEFIRQLTPEQRARNHDFVHDVVRLWEGDTDRRSFNWDGSLEPTYRGVIEMVTQEKFITGVRDGIVLDTEIDALRKSIVREAYENKSMLFPSRIHRHVSEKGEMIKAPLHREPVWSFAHPERKGKAPRFWDINRWPLHLQGEATAANIRSGGSRRDPSSTTNQPGVSSAIFSPLESYPSPQIDQETQSDLAEEMDTDVDASEFQTQTIPGLGKKFAVTFEDLARSRRTFTPGPPQYFLGDTPLQKKAVEDFVKQGIESAEPRTWRQRLGGLFSRREVPDDPTALPEVDPRYIPKSRPRSESSNDSDDESTEEAMPGTLGIDEDDLEMDEASAQLYSENEAGPYSASHFTRAEAPSPMVPSSPSGAMASGIDPLALIQTPTEMASDIEHDATTITEETPKKRRVRRSQLLPSRSVDLRVEELEPESPDELGQDEEDVALRRILRGSG
ncbi:hypothetical protein FGRMN_5705 [Fusarium graminum]|nr:hypothetical protein FGRMN_5705 [Fusarium graminum]